MDLDAEPRYAPYRVAVGTRGLRAYAACPIRAPSGQPVGVLNIADMTPRAWGQSDLLLLADLAALAETDVLVSALGESRLQLLATAEALRSCMLIDPLTQLWNRAATLELVEREHERARRYGEPIALVMAGIDEFSTLRSSEFVAAADLATVEIANRLRSVFRGCDVVGRFEDDQFLVFLGRCQFEAARDLLSRVKHQFDGKPVRIGTNEIDVTLSLALVGTADSRRWSPQDLVEAAASELAGARAASPRQGMSVRSMS
jgi:diguanylate cyclase (GGDEF)-like protein